MSNENDQVKDAASGDEDLEKIMQEIAQEEAALTKEEPSALIDEAKGAPKESTKVHSIYEAAEKSKRSETMSNTNITEKQSLSLELSGSMQIKLLFSSGEKSIEITCSEDAMICKFADGTEFRVPVGKTAEKTSKKSA